MRVSGRRETGGWRRSGAAGVWKVRRRRAGVRTSWGRVKAKLDVWGQVAKYKRMLPTCRPCNTTTSAAYMTEFKVTQKILLAAERSGNSRVYVDTGCAISIFKDRNNLHNIREIRPVTVHGVGGDRSVNMAGDLHLPATSNDGVARYIIINDVLLDEEMPVNLVSADQLRSHGFSVRIEPHDQDCCIVLNQHSASEPIIFPLRCENTIFSVYSPLTPTTTNIPNANTWHCLRETCPWKS
eukprot:2409651-Rhodomonas_salina.1